MQTDRPLLSTKPFRHYFKMHRRLFSAGAITLVITNFFDVLLPYALGKAIDFVRAKDMDGLVNAIFVYCGIMAIVTVFRYLWRIYWGRFHHAVAEDLRNRLFEKFTTLGPSFYQKNPVGQLMSLMTNDINSFRMAIGPGTLILIDGISYFLFIVPIMMFISIDWTWKCLLFFPFVPFLMRKMERLIHERYRVAQDRLAEVSGEAQEIISGIRVIKGYAQEQNKRANFNKISRAYENASNSMAKVDAGFEPMMDFAIAAGGVVLLYMSTPEVARGEFTLGNYVTFFDYIRKMAWPMAAIGAGISMVEQGRASFSRIAEVLSTETDIPDKGTLELTDFESIEVKDLTFQYPAGHAPVLRNVDLTIRAGETIGIVGPVGAGKTTLMNLIARLYSVPPGKILVNGESVENVKQSSLRKLISYVPQDAFLFSDTIAENVALGLHEFPGLDPIKSITRTVNIEQEIDAIPEKYDAHIGERGVNLSGGQKQRLTIARALIRRSPVVILDDSLSAVDGNTERAIVTSLREALSARENHRQTTLIVSHRLATLKHADRIIVMSEGRIEAIGSHAELMQSSRTYQLLSKLQSEEKLNSAGDVTA